MKEGIIGNKYGKLTVVGIAPTPSHIKNQKTLYVYCDCECGNHGVIKHYQNLKSNLTISCGCEYHKVGKRYKTNKYIDKGEYYIFYDSKDEEFYISKCDFDRVIKYTWFVNNSRDKEVVNAANNIKLHRFILEVDDTNIEVDHINHIRNDNRRENLRLVNRSQNNMNHGLKSNNTSGYTGVSYNNRKNKWHAFIRCNNKSHSLGYYDHIDDAVNARRKAEEKYFGSYAYNESLKIGIQNSIPLD